MLGLGLGLRSMGQSLQQKAQAILRSFGSDASSYPFSTRQGAYQTSAGPVVAAVNDPVGLELDALGTVGPELVTNGGGPFTATTGYVVQATGTMSVDAGRLKVVQLAAWTDGIFYYLPAVTVGCTVKFTVVVDLGTATLVQIQLGSTFNNSASGQWDIRASGTYDLFGVWAVGHGGITFKAPSASTFYVSSVQAVEVTGNRATQPTAINRPTVQQDGGGRFYASFNGTNSSMALTSVPFQMADDFAVVACVKYGTPVGWPTIFSSSSAGTVPRIQLTMDATTGFALAYFRDDAGVSVQIGGTVDLRNTTSVITLAKRGTNVYLRVNGVQVATTSVAGLGAATFTASSIGALATSTDWMNGAIYDLDPIKGTVTDAQLLTLEKAVAQKAGLVL